MLHLVSYFKSGFITLSNISERAFCKINQRLKVFNHFCKVLYLGCFARVLSIPLNLTARIAEINLKYTAKNVVISPKFLVWKLCFSAKFPHQEIKWSHDIFGSGSRFNTYRSIEGIWLVYHMFDFLFLLIITELQLLKNRWVNKGVSCQNLSPCPIDS